MKAIGRFRTGPHVRRDRAAVPDGMRIRTPGTNRKCTTRWETVATACDHGLGRLGWTPYLCRMERPTTLKRRNPVVLESTWTDGFVSAILLSDLRDACPCAFCTGEEIMGQKVFAGIKTFSPGMNELESLTPVGNYGVQARWKDGHDTGIYTWELLRSIFEGKRLSEETLAEIERQIG